VLGILDGAAKQLGRDHRGFGFLKTRRRVFNKPQCRGAVECAAWINTRCSVSRIVRFRVGRFWRKAAVPRYVRCWVNKEVICSH
jgi:hypothetical protein